MPQPRRYVMDSGELVGTTGRLVQPDAGRMPNVWDLMDRLNGLNGPNPPPVAPLAPMGVPAAVPLVSPANAVVAPVVAENELPNLSQLSPVYEELSPLDVLAQEGERLMNQTLSPILPRYPELSPLDVLAQEGELRLNQTLQNQTNRALETYRRERQPEEPEESIDTRFQELADKYGVEIDGISGTVYKPTKQIMEPMNDAMQANLMSQINAIASEFGYNVSLKPRGTPQRPSKRTSRYDEASSTSIPPFSSQSESSESYNTLDDDTQLSPNLQDQVYDLRASLMQPQNVFQESNEMTSTNRNLFNASPIGKSPGKSPSKGPRGAFSSNLSPIARTAEAAAAEGGGAGSGDGPAGGGAAGSSSGVFGGGVLSTGKTIEALREKLPQQEQRAKRGSKPTNFYAERATPQQIREATRGGRLPTRRNQQPLDETFYGGTSRMNREQLIGAMRAYNLRRYPENFTDDELRRILSDYERKI